ncbi:DUF4349 domain-containing protein [Gracilibacillus caseinilyticus]|uniref:DUF4349 domain-containing protein n=1 Tax=Gracilibacillus caseinilyticus TaxID=2932256 RepID=A0ABY4EY20_9BACI|nr:DUF4349 domain-containing protein [Gracilibacillus caseinilyticus]UOQ49174.1 DUF4349 domain-containing protein [Gracilibacillus caseinilyticus]
MKKWLFVLIMLLLFTACSNEDDSSNNEAADMAIEESSSESGMSMMKESEVAPSDDMNDSENNATEEQAADEESSSDTAMDNASDRKIIYNANLHVETKQFDDTVNYLEDQTENLGGYVVSSSFNDYEKESSNRFGTMTVRIPSEKFQDFLLLVEEGKLNVLNKSTSGEDVTEQYVDLSSRLKAKEVVEERLLSFMEKAEKTEDLLKISDDLSAVQEEIEQIKGRMQYLDNQSDLATITIEIDETKVDVPSVQDESLNTWEKTQEQFLKSIQTILTIASAIFVFIVGNAPLLILLLIIAAIVFIMIRRRKKREGSAVNHSND